MSSSVLDRRPAKAATALPSSPQPGPLPGEPPTVAPSERLFWILGAVVALVTLAVFLPSVRNAYQLWEIRLAVSEVPEVAAVALGRLAFNLGALLEQYRQPGQALEQYRVAAALLPDDLAACGRAKRLSAAVAPGEAVACAPRGRP